MMVTEEQWRLLTVTPFAGVWIEINTARTILVSKQVTPFAGVWIEMRPQAALDHPPTVTPFAGVWIEI